MLKISILNNRIQYNESEIGYFERMIFMLKRLMSYVSVFAILTSVCVFSANAEDYKVIDSNSALGLEKIREADGWEYIIQYEYDKKNFEFGHDEIREVKVSGYNGTKSDITVPTEYNGFKITEIDAFPDCSDSVKTIRIPKEITKIDADNMDKDYYGAVVKFNGANLREIIVAKGNKKYKSISGVLYTKDGKQLIRYPRAKKEKSFTVPSSVEAIWNYAFANVKYLENLTISENVTSIGEMIYNTSLKKLYYKNTKLKKSHFENREDGVGTAKVGTVYAFKNSGAYNYYKTNINRNSQYDNLKTLSKPTKPKRAEIKKISRTSKGVKITLKEVKCSYQKIYRYNSKAKKYEYIGTTTTKTFYDKTAKSNKTYKYKVRACNKKNLLKANGSYSKAVTIKK